MSKTSSAYSLLPSSSLELANEPIFSLVEGYPRFRKPSRGGGHTSARHTTMHGLARKTMSAQSALNLSKEAPEGTPKWGTCHDKSIATARLCSRSQAALQHYGQQSPLATAGVHSQGRQATVWVVGHTNCHSMVCFRLLVETCSVSVPLLCIILRFVPF